MTIQTRSLCGAIDADRRQLKRRLHRVIHASFRRDSGIDVEFFGPDGACAPAGELDPDQFVIDGVRVDPADDPGFEHDIRLRASYEQPLTAGDEDAPTKEQVDARVIYKLRLRLSPLIYDGEVAVFVIPERP